MIYLQGDGFAKLNIKGIEQGDEIEFICADGESIISNNIECILPETPIKKIYVIRGSDIVAIFGIDRVGFLMDRLDFSIRNEISSCIGDAIICNACFQTLCVNYD